MQPTAFEAKGGNTAIAGALGLAPRTRMPPEPPPPAAKPPPSFWELLLGRAEEEEEEEAVDHGLCCAHRRPRAAVYEYHE